MALKQGWLALALLVVLAAACAWRYAGGLRGRRHQDADLWIAHTARIHGLPRFRVLARRQVRWLALDLACAAVAVVGALLLVARPVAVTSDSREMRARDVMLCLDVSGSMTQADEVVVASYLKLVGRLQGERIGLVVWNSTGVMAFPLTDDYIFVEAQLRSMMAAFGDEEAGAEADEIDGRAVVRAANIGDGSSLIGDGLTSCLLRFDQRARDRPRTVVFATDNQLAGAPLFTLEEAGQKAVDERVLVFGITPGIPDGAQKDELRRVVERTGGRLLDITSDPAMEARIVHGIDRQQRKAILAMPESRSFDQVWPGALVMGVGLVGMVAAAARSRL